GPFVELINEYRQAENKQSQCHANGQREIDKQDLKQEDQRGDSRCYILPNVPPAPSVMQPLSLDANLSDRHLAPLAWLTLPLRSQIVSRLVIRHGALPDETSFGEGS